MLTKQDIQIRDPFVYLEGDTYYLYGTTDKDCWKGQAEGFLCYRSADLLQFQEPVQIFSAGNGFWGTHNFWAPEMHPYRGAYYLFASFKTPGRARATAILKADNPLGPYIPWGEEQVTPYEWECLDGTLFVENQREPYVVFCHEWVQEGGGTICARRLQEDLSAPEGDPVTLFDAREAPWTHRIRHSSGVEGHVTDGPFLYRGMDRLWMLWSSFTGDGYALGLSYSQTGEIKGPWAQIEEPLYFGDGGHGMLFWDKAGTLQLALHAPNKTPMERFLTLAVLDKGDRIVPVHS